MSVIIKGTQMPTSCTMCWLNTLCGVWNIETVKHKGFNKRLDACPLKELIRCKDCKHYYALNEVRGNCSEYNFVEKIPIDYCSWAERKEE